MAVDNEQGATSDTVKHHVPPTAGNLAMWLFLIALGVLFAASLLGYLLVNARMRQPRPILLDGEWGMLAREVPPIHLPPILWLSTIIMIFSSLAVHRALVHIRHKRHSAMRRWITITLLAAIMFVVVQTPSMYVLIGEHMAQLPPVPSLDKPAFATFGLIAVLIAIHALHVLGGIVPLAVVRHRANRGHYDHEDHGPVHYLAMYWHFLDVVWLVMFATLLLSQ